jgi:hypothetical protein
MADLDTLYSKFNDEIKLTPSKRESLITGRDAIRGIIKKGFSEHERNQPKFRMQGSFAMKTTINAIGDDEFDLDDGIYLQGYGNTDQSGWPAAEDVHQWIIDAVDGHTKAAPENKTSCVRVQYRSGYHIDLPSYIIKDDVCFLANKKEGWIESDPKAFRDWFMDYVTNYPLTYGEQLRRTVKYVKAWRDYCGVELESIVVTILLTNHFTCYSGRDDKAVYETIRKVYDALSLNFACKKPVTPYEELISDYSDSKQNRVLDALGDFRDTLKTAIDETDEKAASEALRSVYGSRFPMGKAASTQSSSGFTSTTSPGVIGNDGRSA